MPGTYPRTIVIGDVHGCIVELERLLMEVSFNASRDRLVFVGDLVDRGPRSAETVVRVRELSRHPTVHVVRGNHEEKYIRYRRLLARPATNHKPLPTEKQEVYDQLGPADRQWLSSLPHYYRGEGFLVVHAGVCPRRHLEGEDLDRPQYRYRLLYMRHLDPAGHMCATAADGTGNERHWAEGYDGRFGLVLYGHEPSRTVRQNEHAVGIDTGCCFGGALTAAIVAEGRLRETVAIPALKAYHPAWETEDAPEGVEPPAVTGS